MRPCLDLPRAVQPHGSHGTTGLEADDVARQDHLGAEANRLSNGAVGEVGATQSLREPQVVLNRRALSRLPSGSFALHDDGAQALGRRVHRRGQAGWPAADDAHFVQRLLRGRAQTKRDRKVECRRRAKRLAGRHEHQREVGR
jgi:hypothetical protein